MCFAVVGFTGDVSFGVVGDEWFEEAVDVFMDFCLIGHTGNQKSQGSARRSYQ